ncbi:MAG: radical SAM protein [Candidatus Thermoplasmatota archaeon]
MKETKIKCKTALSKSNLPGLKYSLNPYRGCGHNCAYCYVPNVLHIKRGKWGSFLDIKENIPRVLSEELRSKEKGHVGISTVTDPYQPAEKKHKLTRYCLEQLLIHDFPINIQTKSNVVTRDKDLISNFSNAELMLSIATLDDNERKILEPYSSSIKERVNVLEEFKKADIKKSVFLGPIYPSLDEARIKEMMDVFSDLKVSKVMIDDFNFKPGIWDNVYNKIYENKQLLEGFKRLIQDKKYYTNFKSIIYEQAKDKNMTVVNAF